MSRRKLRLHLIPKESARRNTFKKRKRGLLKKMHELSTLCDVEACAIVASPFDAEPVVWPSHTGVRRVLNRFRNTPELEQNRKMMNMESFMKQRIKKSDEKLGKLRRENRRKEIGHIVRQCLGGASFHTDNLLDLNDIGMVLDQNLQEINIRIQTLKGRGKKIDDDEGKRKRGKSTMMPPSRSSPSSSSDDDDDDDDDE